jgi:hypothetical protein
MLGSCNDIVLHVVLGGDDDHEMGAVLVSAGTSAVIRDGVLQKLELSARLARRACPLRSIGKSGRRGVAFERDFWDGSKRRVKGRTGTDGASWPPS